MVFFKMTLCYLKTRTYICTYYACLCPVVLYRTLKLFGIICYLDIFSKIKLGNGSLNRGFL